jgi:hypothetical protein
VIVDFARTRRFLAWLSTIPAPRGGYTPLGPREAEMMARDNPPGHGASGTDGWIWRGGFWRERVPALEGECAMSIGQAMPPHEPYRLEASLVLIGLVAQLALQGHITGEPE